jgi:hypothetical protein
LQLRFVSAHEIRPFVPVQTDAVTGAVRQAGHFVIGAEARVGDDLARGGVHRFAGRARFGGGEGGVLRATFQLPDVALPLRGFAENESARDVGLVCAHWFPPVVARRPFAPSGIRFGGGKVRALTPLAVRAQEGPLRARVKIDTERVIGEIDPKIYGNFIEHLGRCIGGGVFEEGSPLSDSNGFRKDVMEAVRKLNVTQLRWPGGNFVSNYHWKDGIGPRDGRPRRLEMAWGTVETNRFGTHEFLQYAEMMKTEPYICVNLGTGTWTEAQQWVEYVNSGQDTAMTRLRKQNGRQEPWKVTYWGLGNEMDGPWQMGHRSADDYGKYALGVDHRFGHKVQPDKKM